MAAKGKYDSPLRATFKGITDLFAKQEHKLHLPENIDLSGKTVLIIGASSGLGLAAAKRIASAGGRLIIAMRSGIPEVGEKVSQESGNINVSMIQINLLDFNSIKHFLEELSGHISNIDIVISNAAMVPLKSRRAVQGLEEMFMVNYLSAFYLINGLLRRNLVNPEAGKIIITSSESHRNPKAFDWGRFGVYQEYGINETVARYAYFKLLLTTFANELSRRLAQSEKNIVVRSLCPGPVNSNIAREAPGWLQPILKLTFSIFFRSPKKASDPILYFVSEPASAQERPMDYLFLMQRKEMAEKSIDPENGKKLWQKSEELLKKLGYPLG